MARAARDTVTGVDVQVTPLPGIGTRQDFSSRSGQRIGVINHRDGRMELIVSEPDDQDTMAASVPLTAEESNTLASLLGAPHLVSQLAEQQREVEGITTTQLPIQPGSRYDGRSLGDTAMRTRTGVSIVAVIRQGAVTPSPRPDFEFVGGDLVVVVGTTAGLSQAARILEQG